MWIWTGARIRRCSAFNTANWCQNPIADFRQDKADPEYYSRQTVTRAYASVALGRGDDPETIRHQVAELLTHQRDPEAYAEATVSEMRSHVTPHESQAERFAPR